MEKKPFFLSFSLLILILGFSSCDPCRNIECQNGGVCDEGNCICTDEYEGDNCETKKIAKFIGDYSVSADCDGNTVAYDCAIEEDSAVENGIIFTNFFNLTVNGAQPGDRMKGTVDLETNVITIPAQSVFLVDFTAMTGTLDGGVFSVTYTSDDSGVIRNCTETFTKIN